MDHKTLGWVLIVGGIAALLSSGRIGYSGMVGMMMNPGTFRLPLNPVLSLQSN